MIVDALWKRNFVIAFAIVAVLLTAGTIFGWSALQLVLLAEGVYLERCETSGAAAPMSMAPMSMTPMLMVPMSMTATVSMCDAQVLRLGLAYTIGTVAFQFFTLPIGICLDRFGPRKMMFGGALVLALALLMLSVSDSQSLDLYIPGFLLMCVGGPSIYFASMSFAQYWPERQNTVVSMISSAFDSGTVVFLVYEIVFAKTGLASKKFFALYMSVPAVVLLFTVFLWPQPPPPRPVEKVRVRVKRRVRKPNAPPRNAASARKRAQELKNQEFVMDHGFHVFALSRRDFWPQVKSRPYWLSFAYIALPIMFSNFFIGTFQARAAQFADSEQQTARMVRIFSVILPSSLIFGPFIGWALDKRNLAESFLAIQAMGVLRVVLSMIPTIETQIAAGVVYSVWRPAFYSAMLAFYLRVYGTVNFGKLFGLSLLLSSFVNFFVYLCSYLVVQWDGSFFRLDLFELILALLGLAFPAYIYIQQPRSLWLRKQDA